MTIDIESLPFSSKMYCVLFPDVRGRITDNLMFSFPQSPVACFRGVWRKPLGLISLFGVHLDFPMWLVMSVLHRIVRQWSHSNSIPISVFLQLAQTSSWSPFWLWHFDAWSRRRSPVPKTLLFASLSTRWKLVLSSAKPRPNLTFLEKLNGFLS